jgi:RNA polymerase sigma-70 factor, ECF subfamily
MVARALYRLPEHQREAVILRFWHDCSVEEISEQMGRTPDAVGGLLKRGLRALRIFLNGRG